MYGNHDTVQFDADAEDNKLQSSMSGSDDGTRTSKSQSFTEDKSRTTLGTSTDGPTSSHPGDSSTGSDNLSTATGEHFAPTEEWLTELKVSLPLETMTRLLQHVVPVVDELCTRKNGVLDELDILEVLKDITMVGLLPVPHAIVIRKYQPNQYTALWFTAFMWGVVFLRNQNPPIFDGKAVELFQVSMDETEEDEE